ncbi:MAG: S41 family peptidase [Candidatus Doudnabacteria bacterium]|nr:S41 family peptidase [Candidatus Doudnabacteria bacterium]
MTEKEEPKISPETRSSNPKLFTQVIVVILIAVFFGFGYYLGNGQIKVSSDGIEIDRGRGPSLSADYSLLWDTLDLLNSRFYNKPLDQKELMYGAVKGLVKAAGDPYTVFFDPEESKFFADGLSGTFEGIGAEIGIKNDQLVIIAPLDNTPASRAGLQAGDIILAIDGESSASMSVDQAASLIRGVKGTEVVLAVLKEGERNPVDITILRDKIVVKSLEFETRQLGDKKIALIKISRFSEDTKGLFDRLVDRILTEGFDGIILDLRNNPGGYLETSIDLASNWVDIGEVVVKEVNHENEIQEYDSTIIPRLKGTKTVVLVNEGSASASEILAGALQDYGLATLVGETTFGKGSVQELSELKGDSTLKITVAHWQTPAGRDIDKNGLQPDIVVETTKEDFESDRDPQLDRALELFQ